MDYIDWEDVWAVIGSTLAVAVATVVFVVILAPHKVDGYYVSRQNSTTSATCAYAHWTWHSDELAYCADDPNKVLDFATKANTLVK